MKTFGICGTGFGRGHMF